MRGGIPAGLVAHQESWQVGTQPHVPTRAKAHGEIQGQADLVQPKAGGGGCRGWSPTNAADDSSRHQTGRILVVHPRPHQATCLAAAGAARIACAQGREEGSCNRITTRGSRTTPIPVAETQRPHTLQIDATQVVRLSWPRYGSSPSLTPQYSAQPGGHHPPETSDFSRVHA